MGYNDTLVLNELYQFIYERRTSYTPDRLPQGSEQAYAGSGGKILKRATEIALRSHQAIQNNQVEEFADIPDRKQRQEVKNKISKLVKPVEEKYLRLWAEKQNLLKDNAEFERNWNAQGRLGETENSIYFDEKNQKWIKRNNLIYHSSYLDFFYRMALHNEMFPEAPLELLGFVESSEGLLPLISQPHVSAKKGASRDIVVPYMMKLGYENIPKTDDYINRQTGIRVEDLHDENVLVGDDGLLYVIDPVIYLDDEGKMRRLQSGDSLNELN